MKNFWNFFLDGRQVWSFLDSKFKKSLQVEVRNPMDEEMAYGKLIGACLYEY